MIALIPNLGVMKLLDFYGRKAVRSTLPSSVIGLVVEGIGGCCTYSHLAERSLGLRELPNSFNPVSLDKNYFAMKSKIDI